MEIDADVADAPEPIPQPGLIKTIGVLNILFGGLLLFCGLLGLLVLAPVVLGHTPLEVTPESIQAFADEIRRQRIEGLKAQEAAATTEPQKEPIRQELRKLAAKQPRARDELDFPRINADLAWVARYLTLDTISGPVLNLLMVVAGVGLVLRKNWARELGVATAALKIVRLIVLAALLIRVVVPHFSGVVRALLKSEMGRQLIAHGIEQQRARQGGAAIPTPGPDEIVSVMGSYGTAAAIFFVCLGSIYPIVALVLLSRPGARAACWADRAPFEELPGRTE